MFTFGGNARVFLATGSTDLRGGFNRLHALIAHEFGGQPLNGDLYVFANRRRDLLKIFFYDSGGLWLCTKRLERGTYQWPAPGARLVTLTPTQLQLLVSGLDLTSTRPRAWWTPPPGSAAPATPGATIPPPARRDALASAQSVR